jgi:N-acetylglutamate synthase-like GNAT family acetyltransferase
LLRWLVADAESRGNQWAQQVLARLTAQALQLGITSLYFLTTTDESYCSRVGRKFEQRIDVRYWELQLR